VTIWTAIYTVFVGAWAIYGFVRATRIMVRREGVERLVYVQAASIAFAATMFAAIAYAIVEELADAPALTMWWVWTFGIAVWMVSAFVLTRRHA